MVPQHFGNHRIIGNFNASLENVQTFAVGRDKVSNFIGKSLNLASPYPTGAMTPLD